MIQYFRGIDDGKFNIVTIEVNDSYDMDKKLLEVRRTGSRQLRFGMH